MEGKEVKFRVGAEIVVVTEEAITNQISGDHSIFTALLSVCWFTIGL
jgi:hypothetical protein